jgi:3-methylcrotonyl-CoA carboxylase beta subunit
MIIKSQISTKSDQFLANKKALEGQIADIKSAIDLARAGGGDKARERHLSRG